MRSMTGFGAASRVVPGGRIACEIRTLNHRFLSIRQSLPEGSALLEPRIEQLLKKNIRRGTVHVVVSWSPSAEADGRRLDTRSLKELYRQVCRVQKELGLKEPPRLESLLSLGIVWLPGPSADRAPPSVEAVEPVVRKALARVVRAREREGAATRRVLERLIRNVERLARRLVRLTPRVRRNYRRKIEERLQQVSPAAPQKEIVYKEIASLLDKCDISEEVQRLAHHVSVFRTALRSGGPVGRRLDFLNQEMLRETNTIASKAADAEVIQLTIEIKENLEKVKEQVENVE